MKALTVAALTALLSASAIASGSAQNANSARRGASSTITVEINGLACTTALGNGAFAARSWSLAAENAGGSIGSGGGVGRASVGNLMIKKSFDTCSAPLFAAVTSGRVSRSVLLTQRDADGNVVATLEGTDSLVVSWTVGSTVRDAVPDETLAIAFASICITSSGAPRQCFDSRR